MNNTAASPRNPYLFPFALVCSLFFLWGIANSLNGSLISHFQFALNLERWQAGIVDSAFYFGYFVMAIPAGIFMRKWGYKKGILAGLLLYAFGALLFYPAANIRVYGFFLFALFTIASGLAFLETAANLYVTVLGDKKDAAWRINFAQSFNGISIILGPVIGSLFIFSKKEYTTELLQTMSPTDIEAARVEEALSVQGPYLAVAVIVFAVALLFAFTKMPEVGREEEQTDATKTSFLSVLFGNRHLLLGVLAQFANVAAQATLWGYFVDFKLDFSPLANFAPVLPYADFWHKTILHSTEAITTKQMAGYHASFALVLFMLGRFVGTYLMSRIEARKVLAWYCGAAVVLLIGAFALGSGLTAIIFIMLTYFCHSIVFPTIFALATKGLPPAQVKMASSLVIMSIVGGAIMPPIAGWLSSMGGMRMALIIPLLCFVYITIYTLFLSQPTTNPTAEAYK